MSQTSSSKCPLVTIITVCYNADAVIKKTITSILSQSYKNIEYIIVDGKSTDNTISIINEMLPLLKERGITTTVINESDKGIYDAMNKGIRQANGVWGNFMNAGDCFYNTEVIDQFIKRVQSDTDIFYGDTIMNLSFGDILMKPKPLRYLNKRMAFCHQSAFVKLSCQREHPFDTRYKIAADYEFFYTCYQKNRKFEYQPISISIFEAETGASSNRLQLTKECSQINGSSRQWNFRLKFLIKSISISSKEFSYKLLPKALVLKIRRRNYERLSKRRI